VVAVSLLFFVGCGIFDTREAEAPGSKGTPWVTPSFPEKVFLNLESGLKDLTGVNYEKSLGDAFTFIALPSDVDRLGAAAFADWTKAVEVDVTQRVLGDATKVSVSFINPEQIRNEADFADFRAPYELIVTYTRGDIDTFKAVAQFDMQRLGQGWSLIRWTDQEGVEGFATWGYLRGTTRTPTTP
jgi:hypothetical protein